MFGFRNLKNVALGMSEGGDYGWGSNWLVKQVAVWAASRCRRLGLIKHSKPEKRKEDGWKDTNEIRIVRCYRESLGSERTLKRRINSWNWEPSLCAHCHLLQLHIPLPGKRYAAYSS